LSFRFSFLCFTGPERDVEDAGHCTREFPNCHKEAVVSIGSEWLPTLGFVIDLIPLYNAATYSYYERRIYDAQHGSH
jgi:hypothetical protein